MPSRPRSSQFAQLRPTWLGLLLAAACSPSSRAPAELTAADVAWLSGPIVALDSTLLVRFPAPLDPASVTEGSVAVVALDGPTAGQNAAGQFTVHEDLLQFAPELPRREPLATAGGLRAGTRYALQLAAGPAAIRTRSGVGLKQPLALPFTTRNGATASELFAQNRAGGPAFTGALATPRTTSGDWELNRSSGPAELRLRFDQPLHPGLENLPATTTAPGTPFALHYDDPEHGPDLALPCDLELERNTAAGATVVLRPRGVLPSAATLRAIVQPHLVDLWGEPRGGAAEAVATISTETAYAPQFGALDFDFTRLPLGAPDFAEVPAEVRDGALRVPASLPTLPGVGDWVPPTAQIELSTHTQTLTYLDAPPRTFAGGVLHVRNLHIRAGDFVQARGPNPLVLVVAGDARIDGTLSVAGAHAVLATNAGQYRGPGDLPPGTNVPNPPGTFAWWNSAGAGGGHGGTMPLGCRLDTVAPGQDAVAAPGTGGAGGRWDCPAIRSSGGGGGAMATYGDPWYPSAALPNLFPQRSGHGGRGGPGSAGALSRALLGGPPGTAVFANGDPSDDHWGDLWNPVLGRRIRGELPQPIGGGGGGASGNSSYETCAPESTLVWRGQNGGGGGGALVLQVRGTLTIGPSGRITADGGHGVLHNPLYVDVVGGGGGGAGGMVVLMAGERLVIHTHGETFANRDYDFAVSADGGACRRPNVGSAATILSKYPANGQTTLPSSAWDELPMGGFGGLGVIQLLVPMGTDNADGTNTVLDDRIDIVQNGAPLQGLAKQRFLGWRGHADGHGQYVDDFGLPTGTRGGMGDLRPDPILMPVPFAVRGRARARSAWVPLAGMLRRSVATPDGGARAVVGESFTCRPLAQTDGWLPFVASGHSAAATGPGLLPRAEAIGAVQPGAFAEQHQVRLQAPLPLPERDAYVGYMAEFRLGTEGRLARAPIVRSEGQVLVVHSERTLPPQATHVQIVALSVDLSSPETPTYRGSTGAWLPRTNVRLGFAFHRDPTQAVTQGLDPLRLPRLPGTFVADPAEPGFAAALRAFGPCHVQCEVLLDGEFQANPGDQPPAASAEFTPAVRHVWLPVRY